ADPIFKKDNAKISELPSVTSFYRGVQIDLPALARALGPLPSTADEVRAISGVFKESESELNLRAGASEANVKRSKLVDYRIVYFATHGLLAGEVEMFAKAKVEPALALTIPEKPTELDDGLLMASEVAQLKLNADWVVLSACNTAAEGKPGAEPLSGLASAFFYAGSRSLLVSHWSVEVNSSVQLMAGTFAAIAADP